MPTDLRPEQHRRAAIDDSSSAVGGSPESVEWLIDNAETYVRLLEALCGAQRSIRIAQLALDSDCVAREQATSTGAASSPSPEGTTFAETLLAIDARSDVEISLLINATLLLDTATPLRRFLAAANARGIRVRGAGHFPWLLHAKMVIIDGTDAFIIGSPFVNGYRDDERHRPVDASRPLRELGGRPLHDVSVRVTGPVVGDLDRFFCDLWNGAPAAADDRASPLVPDRAPATTDTSSRALRLVRTLSPGVVRSEPAGTTGILDACLEGIASARSLIYIEHQYLSSRPVVAALAAALARAPALEIVAVLNENPDITAYRGWQAARLAESGLLGHPRVGLFALWSAEPDAVTGRLAINQVFVHSKVLAIDDRWATIGSANLDGVSLHSYGDDFEGWLGRSIFRGIRNVDANIVVDETVASMPSGHSVTDLRRRLWSEHLGMADDEVAAIPSGTSLELWRARAAANVEALNARPTGPATTRRMRGFVLPYSLGPTPAGQLADIGVRVSAAGLDLRFDPGWLEIHFSPNWVRNMFA